MTSPLVKKLIQIPVCRGLKESEAAEIFEIAEEVSAWKGSHLFREGDPGDSLYVVLEGTLEITKRDKAGKEQQLAKVSDGSVIGEMSLIAGSAARSASALAVTDLKLLKVPVRRFTKLLQDDNVAALKVVQNIAQVLSRRLLMMDEKLVDVMNTGKRKEELQDFQRILTNWQF
jgi:CRP/FNR family transcriptional regulator, cyclic AMP receptor protein